MDHIISCVLDALIFISLGIALDEGFRLFKSIFEAMRKPKGNVLFKEDK